MDNAEFGRRIVAEAPDGVLYADQDGVIRIWNGGCQRIFGFSPQEAIGQSLDIIIPEGLRARHWHGYAQTMRSGQTRYAASDLLSVPAVRRDGARISVEFSIIPFRDKSGTMIGIGAIMRDVNSSLRGDEGVADSTQGFEGAGRRLGCLIADSPDYNVPPDSKLTARANI